MEKDNRNEKDHRNKNNFTKGGRWVTFKQLERGISTVKSNIDRVKKILNQYIDIITVCKILFDCKNIIFFWNKGA